MRKTSRYFASRILLPLQLTIGILASGCAGLSNVTAIYPSGPAIAAYACLKSYDAIGDCGKAEKSGLLDDAVLCANTTRDAYGSFLLCREERQLWGGAFISALAAGAAGVATAGVSTAAVALGATASAGLAFDYATYNKAKSKAYADATVQLQCVVTDVGPFSSPRLSANFKQSGPDASPLQQLLQEYQKDKDSIDQTVTALKNTYASIGSSSHHQACQSKLGQDYKQADLEWQQTKLEISQFTPLRYLIDARIYLASRREQYFETRGQQMSLDIVAAVKTVDVRAFAASQSGVPDADQIAKAVQAASSAIPGAKSPASTGSAPMLTISPSLVAAARAPAPGECDALASALHHFHQTYSGLGAPLTDATNTINQIAPRLSDFDQALAALRIPDGSFSECLTLKSFVESADSGPSSSSKSASSTGSNKSNSAGTQSASNSQQSNAASDNNASSAAQKPTEIAFQVLPSDTVQIDPTKAPTATIKIVGGRPPYYWTVVDADSIGVVNASQNALFVGLDVAFVDNAKQGRLLLGDSAGADEVVYISRAAAADSSKDTSKGTGANQSGAIINYGTIKGK